MIAVEMETIHNRYRGKDSDGPKNYNPLVSICCATYNHEQFIGTAIESFLMQEVDFETEILIHDDASTDSTSEILSSYANKYPGLIKIVTQTKNQFEIEKRILSKFLFPKTKGKYIALCEGDDYWTDQRKLLKQVSFLEQNDRFVGCFTDFRTVDNEDKTVQNSNFVNMKSEYTHLDILKGQTPKTLTTVFRREFIPTFQPSRKGLNSDLILASFLSRNGSYKYLDFVSGAYRIHNTGIWSTIDSLSKYKNQLVTSLELMKQFRKMEELDALKHRFKMAGKNLVSICRKERNYKMIVWYKILNLRSFFKYSPSQIVSKFYHRIIHD